MAYAAVVSLSQLLGHILHHPHKYFCIPLSDERQILEFLHEKSSFLQAFLDDYSHKGGEAVQSLEVKIRDAMYQAQDIIECHIYNQNGTSYVGRRVKDLSKSVLSIIRNKKQLGTRNKKYKVDLLESLDQIDLIVKETMIIQKSCSIEESQFGTTQTPALVSSSQAGSSKNEMVGYEEDRIGILARLCGESNLDVIPIVGMGGIGKTTFARNIFGDRCITDYFDIRAWATVSQQYHLQGILLGILHSLSLETDLSNTTNEQLIIRIYQHLYGRRYLIVLDDMWSTRAWDDLRRVFPDNNNGSRMIITIRLRNVAYYASSSPIHKMHFLDRDETGICFKKRCS